MTMLMFNKLNNENMYSLMLVALLIFFCYSIVSSGKSEITADAYQNLNAGLSAKGRAVAVELYRSHTPHMLTQHDYDTVLRSYLPIKEASEPIDKKTATSWLKEGGGHASR